ncbi:HAD-IIB family hydrolase [Terrilactibacillus sp. S3-3]|nr:HAD-IIB family hydrolase [Terrilactibacillus sp. S3-3]
MRFVFDLDGTICFEGKPLSKNIVLTLTNLIELGHDVIIASARPIRDILLPIIPNEFKSLTLIGGNGSLISVNGRLFSTSFSQEEMEEVKRIITKYNATYLIDSDWDYAYTGPNDHPILRNLDPGQLANRKTLDSLPSVVKVLFITANDFEKLVSELSLMEVVVHRHRNEDIVDISPKNVDKWTALEKIGVEKFSYIAFGNDANDISMFKSAGLRLWLATMRNCHFTLTSQFL